MANVILINPCTRNTVGSTASTLIMPPLGLAYIAASLEKHNHQVQIVDANLLNIMHDNIVSAFSIRPDLIGVAINIVSCKEALKCSEQIKKEWSDVPIILGGPQGFTNAEDILVKNNFVDAVIIGEGEQAMVEVSAQLNAGNIFQCVAGVSYKRQGEVIHNQPRLPHDNIDDLPFAAYHLMPDINKYRARSRATPVGYLITSRGCPSQCTFCSQSLGMKWRPHSVERVVSDIDYLVNTIRVKQIDILDDNFTFDMDRAGRILDLIAQKHPKLCINLQNGVRVDKVNEELILKMKKAGIFKIAFGIESGDQYILKKIKKNLDLERAVELTKFARKIGMITQGYFMMGFPEDTKETMAKTIDFSLRMNPHYANFSIFTPLPGTQLFSEIKERGDFRVDVGNGIDDGFFSLDVLYKPLSTTPQEIVRLYKTAWKKFYLRRSKVLDILSTIRSRGEFLWLSRVAGDALKAATSK